LEEAWKKRLDGPVACLIADGKKNILAVSSSLMKIEWKVYLIIGMAVSEAKMSDG